MAPHFSVLLPTHNRADLIGYAIKSVLWQTEQDFELLIVGDGCTDDTADVVAGFSDPRIRWFDLPKAPFFGYANRNVALREAKGDFIGFVAHDDLLFPDHLVRLAESLERERAEWAYSRPLWVSADGKIVPFALNLTNADELENFLTVGNSIPTPCVMHRRSCLETYGYWPEDVASAADWRLWIRIIEGGGRHRLAYCRTPTCLHFKASWRDGRTGHPAADAGLAAAEMLGWWPPALKLEIPPRQTEQQAYFDVIEAGGVRWLEAVRTGTREALDRLAWTALTNLVPLTLAQQAQNAQLSSQRDGLSMEGARLALERDRVSAKLARHEARLSKVNAHLQAVYSSRSWRLTRPLRALKDRFDKWLH